MSWKASLRLLGLVVVGLLSLGYCVLEVADQHIFSASAETVTGRVVRKWTEVKQAHRHRLTEHHVRYVYDVDGRSYSGSYDMMSAGDWRPLREGGPVVIEYAPQSPWVSRPRSTHLVHTNILVIFCGSVLVLGLATAGTIAPRILEA